MNSNSLTLHHKSEMEFYNHITREDLEGYDNDISYPFNKNLYDLFESIAQSKSQQNAIIDHLDKRYSYQELHLEVIRVSKELTKLGVTEGSLVGIFLNPSFDLIVSILSVIKLKGVYLPLDVDSPEERLQYFAANSKVNCILTLSTNNKNYAFSPELLVFLDMISQHDKELFSDAQKELKDNNLACLIYTSGSTSTPKAVMIRHDNIINRCYWFKKCFLNDKAEMFCLNTTINFVDSIGVIFTALIFGKTLYIPSKANILDLNFFLENIKAKNVTHLVVVPSFLKLMLEHYGAGHFFKNLRRIVCSGDVLSYDICEMFFSLKLPTKLYNYYGSTEVTADVSFYEIKKTDIKPGQKISIGQEVSNTKLIILDSDGKIASTGQQGTIYVYGRCLTMGYLRDDVLSKTKFVYLKIGEERCRFFNTGDLGYKAADGNFYFLGRADSIININGNRISLLEIENVLKNITYIRDVVTLDIKIHNEIKLVAFIVLCINLQGYSPSNTIVKIEEKLSQFLPQYMIPSLRLLESLPLTISGKVDRELLRSMLHENTKNYPKKKFNPTNVQEKFLKDQFLELLNIQEVEIDEDFFDLGGSSLSLIKLISRFEKYFSLKVQYSDIVNHTSIAGLLKIIDKKRKVLGSKYNES